jgi:hypothetical protein
MQRLVLVMLAVALASVLTSQSIQAATINLDAVIGAPGTRAAIGLTTVAGEPIAPVGAGNVLNWNGAASNTGATQLSSDGASTFNFNTGFADSLDRTTGTSLNHNATFADRKSEGADTYTDGADRLIFDKDNNGDFGNETDEAPSDANTYGLGFGMHADAFITFDLNKLRTDNGIASGSGFTLSGGTGVANFHPGKAGFNNPKNSTAIILDGVVVGVFDFNDVISGVTTDANGITTGTPGAGYNQFQTFSNLAIPGSGHYLTFIGLSGDTGISGAHMGFSDVQLFTPEPSSLIAVVGGVFALASRRKHAAAR